MPAVQYSPADAAPQWDSGLLGALYDLVFSAPDREVAGVFVGSRPDGSQASALPLIQAAVPATQGFVPGQAATFDRQTWAQVNAHIASQHPGLDTVGWYVSRPGRGTGLLEADVVNHTRWFSRPDQILLVANSRTYQGAMYAWLNGQLTLVTEGPVARRYTRPRPPRFPLAALSLLIIVGIALGAVAFIIAQAAGG